MSDHLEHLTSALADRYTVDRELGRGGMATVYLAEDLKHHRKVAIKVLRPELAATLAADRFQREIEIAAKLVHPHILPVLDSGSTEEQPTAVPPYRRTALLYYVMPYVEGESLRDRLNRERQLPIEDSLTLTREVASALSYAHDHGVIHRDIKPENIMLSAGGALVADYGIARAITAAAGDRLTETGLAVGTPAYMSPEQATGSHEIDARSDVYSLGCVLYEMLAGDAPYIASTPQTLLAKKLAEPTPRVSVVRESVPYGVEVALERALAKAPADRFATPRHFVDALEKPLKPVPTGSMRRRLAWGSSLVLGVVAAILIGHAISTSTRAAQTLNRSSIVVVPIVNETGDAELDQLADFAAHRIASGLQRMEDTRVISPNIVQEYRESGGAADMTSLAGHFSAGTVISGSMFGFAESDSLRFEMLVTDAARNGQMGQFTVALPRSSPEQHVEVVQEQVLSLMAVVLDPAFGDMAATAPTSFQAFELLREARFSWMTDVDDPSARRRAASLALESYRTDTGYVAALYWAYEYSFGSEPPSVSDSLLQQLTVRVNRLPRAYYYMFQHQLARRDRDIERAYDMARRSFDADPTFASAANQRAFFALLSNRPHDVLQTLEPVFYLLELEEFRSWFAWWVFRCVALHMLGQHDEELRVARRAREDFPLNLAVVVTEGRALVAQGRVEDAMAFLDDNRAAPSGVLHRLGAGWLRHEVGLELLAHGHPDTGREVLNEAAEWFDSNAPGAAQPLDYQWSRAEALYAAGDWDGAARIVDSLATAYPDTITIRGRDMTAALPGYQGMIAAGRGRRDVALEIDSRLEMLASPGRGGMNTWFRAKIAALLGDREKAVRLLQQHFEEGSLAPRGGITNSSLFFRIHLDPDLGSLRGYAPFEEFMRPKG